MQHCLFLNLLISAFLLTNAAQAQNTSLKATPIISGLEHPWAMSLLPDGQLLITERPGRLQIVNPANGRKRTIGGLPEIRVESEAGAMGLALDSDFVSNNRIYLCYSTEHAGTSGNQLSAFTLKDNHLADEQILLGNMPGARWHNGCRVSVSASGHLYASMGDATDAQSAQDERALSGKIFRLNRDGSIPSDNPFAASPIWSYGHRNPQGLAFRPSDGTLWSTEHGPDTQDEVNLIKKGANYGWPLCRGTETCAGIAQYQPAIAEFNHDDTIAISDLIFYRGKMFPDWQDDILFVSLKTGRLYHLDIEGEKIRASHILIDDEFGRLRTLAEAPDGSLYLATDNGEDQILHVTPR